MAGCGSPGRGRSQACFLGYGLVQSDGDGAIHRVERCRENQVGVGIRFVLTPKGFRTSHANQAEFVVGLL